MFNDLWLVNGNPGHNTGFENNWLEVGTAYCDKYKSAAHYVFARGEGGVYFEDHIENAYRTDHTTFKLNRPSTWQQQYIAYILRPNEPVITAGTQVPSVNEISNYGGNWAQVGTEVSYMSGTLLGANAHYNLRRKAGVTASVQNWSGTDNCVQTNDPTRMSWQSSTQVNTWRSSDADVFPC